MYKLGRQKIDIFFQIFLENILTFQPNCLLCSKCQTLFSWEMQDNIFPTIVCWNFYPEV